MAHQPKRPHPVVPDVENDVVGGLVIVDANDQTLRAFHASTPENEIRRYAESVGPGVYSVHALHYETKKRIQGRKDLHVRATPTPPMPPTPQASQDNNAAFDFLREAREEQARQLAAMREQLEADRVKLEAERHAAQQEILKAKERETSALMAFMERERERDREQRKAEDQARQAARVAELESRKIEAERAKQAEDERRAMREMYEQRMRDDNAERLERERRDAEEKIARERERAHEDMERLRLSLQSQLEIQKQTHEIQLAQLKASLPDADIDDETKIEWNRRRMEREYPEPNPVEQWVVMLQPLIEMVAAKIPALRGLPMGAPKGGSRPLFPTQPTNGHARPSEPPQENAPSSEGVFSEQNT